MGEEGVEEARISSRRREDEEEVVQQQQQLGRKERKISWAKLRRVDSLNLEAQAELPHHHHHQYGSSSSSSRAQWTRTLSFAFQCIGVVYGDIGTSPLYVYKSTFTNGIKRKEDILGVLSLIIYTMLLIPMVKYVSIVLWANDNGDGGTFALYSLLCRHLKVSLIPNGQPEDAQLSNYNLLLPSASTATRLHVKQKLETSRPLQMLLFLVTILGTSMVIGDGVLTPAISVMSAVDGIASSLGQDAVVGISVAILVVTFAVQRFGTDKVGFSFAPIILIWFMFIAGIGAYNLFKYDVGVLRAFNPKYIIDYFSNNGKEAWISLGGVVLCITGTEAMFADLGHFNVPAVQISFSGLVFPAITTAYIGQAAYLTKFPEHVDDTFYKSIPDPLYWPTFVVAIAAAIIASQAMISGAFAIISQSLSLGCFPRVKVVHTSAKYEGQVYIPEINYLLMIACVIVVIAFKSTEQIGHAYGIAVVAVMVMTTCMVSLIMLVIWRTRLVWIVVFFLVFGLMEVVYLSAVLYKFKQGGYLPLAFSLFLMMIMGIWHYVHKQRYMYELKNKVSPEYIAQLLQQGDGTSTKGTTAKGTNANTTTISRVPGMAFLYSELVQGIPPIFPHFLANIPSIHSVLVFVSLKSLPISKVLPQERFLFRQVEPKEYRMFRCVVRYGYNDVIEEPHEFERQLVHNLKDFIRHDHFIREGALLAPPPPTASLINNDDSGGHVDINSDSQHNASVTTATAHSGRRSFNSIVHVEEALQQPMHGSHRVSSRRSSSSIQSTSARPNNNNENSNHIINDGTSSNIGITSVRSAGGNKLSLSPLLATVEEETQFVQKAMDNGVVYLLGEAEVVAEPNSSLLKKFVVNYAYGFLRKNFREGEKVLAIPQTRLLRVGMTYEI